MTETKSSRHAVKSEFVVEGVRQITLNRPEALNAFSPSLYEGLLAAFDHAEDDIETRVIIVAGEGKVFCAGADFASSPDDWERIQPKHDDVTRDAGGVAALRIFRCDKPVIFAFDGPAVGVGVTMSLPADIRIASERAHFSFPFSRRGVVCESACSWFLPRIVGAPKALEWTLRGHRIPATEALQSGLVSELVTEKSALDRAKEIASEMVENCSPFSMSKIKRLYWEGEERPNPYDAHIAESRLLARAFRSAEFEEGVNAFLEKRSPRFRALGS